MIYAERSAFEDIVEGARDILSCADTTLAAVERVVEDNREDISDIITNARVFSEALAKNADGVGHLHVERRQHRRGAAEAVGTA
ncbi:MAG: hypothetical protein HPM95_16080 [Alphaproteobacteria bacterium]|nr:hypothetical protein [Alphaproteobacteria bacterium]